MRKEQQSERLEMGSEEEPQMERKQRKEMVKGREVRWGMVFILGRSSWVWSWRFCLMKS